MIVNSFHTRVLGAVLAIIAIFKLEPYLRNSKPKYRSPHYHTNPNCFNNKIPKVVATTSERAQAKYDIEIQGRLGKHWRHVHYSDAAAKAYILKRCPSVADAFSCMRPGAYKADIFRVCWLYTHGGLYLDNDRIPVLSPETMVSQASCLAPVTASRGVDHKIFPWLWYSPRVELVVTLAAPGQPFFLCILNSIVLNHLNHFYGHDATEITGPTLAAKCFLAHASNVSLAWYYNDKDTINSYETDMPIVRGDHQSMLYMNHYSELWHNRLVHACDTHLP